MRPPPPAPGTPPLRPLRQLLFAERWTARRTGIFETCELLVRDTQQKKEQHTTHRARSGRWFAVGIGLWMRSRHPRPQSPNSRAETQKPWAKSRTKRETTMSSQPLSHESGNYMQQMKHALGHAASAATWSEKQKPTRGKRQPPRWR